MNYQQFRFPKRKQEARYWLLVLPLLTCNLALADVLVFSSTERHMLRDEFRDMPAKFGDPIPPEGIKGLVMYADPPTACNEIKPPPNVTNETENWIVLIARYNCSFELKIRMAQLAGFDAAIVHNVDSDDLEPMSAKVPVGLLIPSIFVSEMTGLRIRQRYLYNSRNFYILINDDLPFNINTHLLLPFAIVVGICFFIMVIFMIVRCIKDRRRQRRHRLPYSSLKKIPTHKYSKGDPYETCAICLDDYVEGEKLRVLPCAHAYHAKCIDPWLTKNRRVCPCCKRKVFAADERVVTDSESDSDVDDSTPLIRDGRSGTQGGTFTSSPQQLPEGGNRIGSDHPFITVRLPRGNRVGRGTSDEDYEDDSQSTDSSTGFSNLAPDYLPSHVDSYEPGEGGQRAPPPFFTVSDDHSINGEGETELEHSESSTKSQTADLSKKTDEKYFQKLEDVLQRGRLRCLDDMRSRGVFTSGNRNNSGGGGSSSNVNRTDQTSAATSTATRALSQRDRSSRA